MVVGLDDRVHPQVRPHLGERPAETRHLLRMVDRAELPRDHHHPALSREEPAHELPDERAGGERVHAHGHEVFDLGRVGIHADHGQAALRRLLQERGQGHRLARHHDQSVEVVRQGFRQRFLFAVSQVPDRSDGSTLTSLVSTERTASWIPSRHEVEERRDLAGKVDADPELLLGDEEARRQVRSVAERLGPLQDPAARLLVDPGVGCGARGRRSRSRGRGSSRFRGFPAACSARRAPSWPGHSHPRRLRPSTRARPLLQSSLDRSRGRHKILDSPGPCDYGSR